MIFEDKSLITLFGLIVLLILFFNMTSEKFQNVNSETIKIINNNSNNKIPSIIENPYENPYIVNNPSYFINNGSNFIYNAISETLTGKFKDKLGNDIEASYIFTLKPCAFLIYDINTTKLVCKSSI